MPFRGEWIGCFGASVSCTAAGQRTMPLSPRLRYAYLGLIKSGLSEATPFTSSTSPHLTSPHLSSPPFLLSSSPPILLSSHPPFLPSSFPPFTHFPFQ